MVRCAGSRSARPAVADEYFVLASARRLVFMKLVCQSLGEATPAALLISTGKTVPFSKSNCTRTFPSSSERAAPAARQSRAGGAAPGSCSVFCNSAIATAGASSLDMATSVGDFLTRVLVVCLRRLPLEVTFLPRCFEGLEVVMSTQRVLQTKGNHRA
jgi:hypothetical protein